MGTAEEFLGLPPVESRYIELKFVPRRSPFHESSQTLPPIRTWKNITLRGRYAILRSLRWEAQERWPEVCLEPVSPTTGTRRLIFRMALTAGEWLTS